MSSQLPENPYNIAYWSNGYFSVNQQGQVVVHPSADQASIALPEVVNALKKQGLSTPVLVRFPEILQHRIKSLHTAFQQAISQFSYQAGYTPVYPIKVNQQFSVLSAMTESSQQTIGFEAGSKAELLAIIALAEKCQKPCKLIANGYKDREFIQLAFMGQQLGHEVLIIIEKPNELKLVMEEAIAFNIEPQLGIRVRLASIGVGKWQNTGGEKGKFGLSASQIMQALKELKASNNLHWFKLLHFHMGSQIANIQDIQKGLSEGVHFYKELRQLGASKLSIIDVGGGLGIDYDGTRSRHDCSMNYSLHEYANNVVRIFSEKCTEYNVVQPHIITEAGRAMTAHHAVLITDIIQTEEHLGKSPPASIPEDAARVLHDLTDNLNLVDKSPLEVFHNAIFHYQQALSLFTLGQLSLTQRSCAEKIYSHTLQKLTDALSPSVRSHQELLDQINLKLADKMVCNFSLFQSLPDIWALKQIFPIMPLSSLNQPLTQQAILHDMTCDSDGRIDTYVTSEGASNTLLLPKQNPEKPYDLGLFLVGAYQETLGDIHNLFGDTHTADVRLSSDGFALSNIQKGDKLSDVLGYVHFKQEKILAMLNNANASREFSEYFQNALESYCYLQK